MLPVEVDSAHTRACRAVQLVASRFVAARSAVPAEEPSAATVERRVRRTRAAGGTARRCRADRGAALVAVAVALLAACAARAAGTPAAKFGFDDVTVRAQELAKDSFKDPRGEVPPWLTQISYDQWRDIRFRPDRALWKGRKLPFEVQFFHPGFYYDRTVKVNVVEDGSVRPVQFSPSDFDYGRNDFASRVPQNLGFAGFRVHAPIKKRDYYDEVIVFLGASYFRAVGKDEVFGLSARGIAIDTALSSGEEFPYFREFWIVTPAPTTKELTVYALLDSVSLTGAYQFVIRPGEQTATAVDARVFLRREPKKLGIAPLTSMFFHGENSMRPADDFRPEVHDSDGLLVNFSSGEWLWRPLDNPHALQVSDFRASDIRGYGLIQRDRSFEHYQDLETRPEFRPSAWVVPRTGWGEGQVELVEIPTKSDTNDNIVTYWVPNNPPEPGTMGAWSYTIYWYGDAPDVSPGGRVVATRRDRGTAEGAYRFVIDFAGKKLDALPADTVLRGVVTIASGDETAELLDQQVVKNPATGGWRLTFQIRPKRNDPVELRAFLDQGGNSLTETWSTVVVP
jgi:glucans biosynthesis protein